MELAQWQRFRWLGFKAIEPYLEKGSSLSLHDILPLPNDPTQEELRELREYQTKKDQEVYKRIFERHRKGLN